MAKPKVVRRTRKKPPVVSARITMYVEVEPARTFEAFEAMGGNGALSKVLKDYGIRVVHGEVTTEF
jgi:hypothetical protein